VFLGTHERVGALKRLPYAGHGPRGTHYRLPSGSRALGRHVHEAKAMTRDSIKLVHEGGYAAEIRVELIEDETGWSPYLSHEDRPGSAGVAGRRYRDGCEPGEGLSAGAGRGVTPRGSGGVTPVSMNRVARHISHCARDTAPAVSRVRGRSAPRRVGRTGG
jgi:hypothetical protein